MRRPSEAFRRYNHLTSEINSLYHILAVKLGISDSVLCILYCLCEEGYSRPQSEICSLTGVSRQTINSAIRQLEKQGLIYLEYGPGRRTTVCLTEAGKAFAEEKIEPVFRMENEIFDEWTADEVKTYLRLTERYRDAMRARLIPDEQ